MTEPPPGAAPRRPDLTLARDQVRAIVAGSALARQPPAVRAQFPLTFLDAATEAKLAKRAAAGLTGVADFPRRAVLLRAVAPSAALAVLDAIGLGVALVAGNVVLVVVAAVLLVLFVLIAVGGWRFVRDDTLRLSTSQARAVSAARSWRSKQDWSGPQGSGSERGLVLAAADAATRISRTPFWRAGQIHDVLVHLDLARELDAIDAAAHRMTGSGSGASGPEWDALLDRVAALSAYANQVDGYEQRRDAIAAHNRAQADDALLPTAPDDDETVALLVYLNAVLPG